MNIISTWILIIFFGGTMGDAGVTIKTIPGYKSGEQCKVAQKKLPEKIHNRLHIKSACIPYN